MELVIVQIIRWKMELIVFLYSRPIRVMHETKYLFLLYGLCMELSICSYYTGDTWN